MKRFSKILVAVLALCLLVGALALAISANTGVKGNFVVQGTGYETWEDALAAADNTHTIYINENWELGAAITVTGAATNVKVNLNGKTVSYVGSDSVAFSVQAGAKFTITGEGVLNSVSGLISAQGASTVNFDATGSGIVINHDKNGESIQFHTFRIHDRSNLNVSGAITVNATNGARYVFNLKEGNETSAAAQFNLSNAKINVPLVTRTDVGVGGRSQLIILGVGVNATITDSEIDARNSNMIVADVTGEDRSNTTYKDANSPYKWLEGAAANVDIPDGNITLTAKNSTFLSCYETKVSSAGMGSIMHVSSRLRASFDKCNFYGDHRAVTSSTQNSTGQYVKSHQLLFTDCNFAQAPKNSGSAGAQNVEEFFIYGVNYKIIGGTYSYYNQGIANGSSYYLELTDAEGNPTGEWCGGYIDNVLLSSDFTIFDGINTNASGDPYYIDGNWRESSYTVPNSKKTDTITLIVDGVSRKFVCGYFSDTDRYNAYFAVEEHVWDDGIYSISDGNVEGADYYQPDGGKPTGTKNLTNINLGNDRGIWESVTDKASGNGYMKLSYDNTDGTSKVSQSTSSKYISISSAHGSLGITYVKDYPQIVFEFDVRSETGCFPYFDLTTQTRVTTPVYDAEGNVTSTIDSSYKGAPCFNNVTIDGTTIGGVNVSDSIGEWHRLTLVYDFKITPVDNITGSAYYGKDAISTIPEGKSLSGYSFLGSKLHFFLDGVLVNSVDYVGKTSFFGGAIPEGYEDTFYFLEQRISPAFYAGKNSSISIDNIRVSRYAANVDLDLYNQDGSVKTDINGLDHFLIMPNNTTVSTNAAKVDGVEYSTEAKALEAIKEGSTVELLKDFESYVPANVEFKLVTNGYTVPGFVSATHTPVDYVGSFGYIKLVPASASELYTVNYTFNGETKTQTVAKGTLIPAMDTDFPSIIDGNTATVVVGWTLPVNVPTDYNTAGNVINAIEVTEDRDIAILVGNTVYENLADAVAGANGETIVLCKDITVDALDGVTASTYITASATSKTNVPVGINIASGANVTIDFNGKTVTQNFEGVLFNVTNGTLTLTGAATFNNVGTFARATGENSKVVANATGDGFDINSSGKTYNVFVAEGRANLEASGVIDIYAAVSTIIFKLSGSDTTKITDATIISYGPTAEQGVRCSKFFAVSDGNTVNIESSKLEVKCGDMFIANGADYAFSLKDKLAKDANGGLLLQVDSQYIENGKIKDVYFPEFTINVTANNSQFIASPGEPNASYQSSTGGLFRLGDTATKVVLTNCKLEGDSRPIHGDDSSDDGRPWGSSEVSPNQFIFINVDYKRATFAVDSSTGKVPSENSPNTLQSNTNVLWIGGTLKDFSTGPQFVPMFAQNGVIGVHFVNIASGSNLGYTTATKVEYGGDRTVRPGSVWSTEYYNAYSGAAFVDYMFYATEAEAIAAIKPGSEVLLTKDFKTNAALTGDCKILTNGYFKAPGIVSATHKAAVGANGDVTVSAALPEEIFTINYAFGGKTATQNAALGTVVATPEGIDDRFVDSDSKKLVVLKGWTLVDGENVVVVTGNANAIAKYDSADPVIVYWTTADGKTVLDTDYYLPGEYTTLPEFNGEDIKPDHTADYYSIVRTGWDGIDTVKLDVAGEYTVKAVMSKVAPDTFPGLKYNITLYANYLLNFWLPKNINGVKSYVVSTVVDGSTQLKKVTNANGGTIENVEYDAFGYILGAAGTDLRSFYIVYTLDDEAETKLAFEVKDMGIPLYAMQLLTQYQEENKTDAKSEAAKSLVVNMANYADQVLNVTGGDKTTPGAKAYTYILNTYGAQYLNRYNNLTNDKFLEGGEIYKADGVADLNWITKTDASEGNMTALSYISAITFNFDTIEPKFIIELTKNVDTLGLQKPSGGAGDTGAHAMGLHAFAGYVGGNPTYCNMWAISKEDGKKWTNNGNMWMEKDGTNGTNSTLYTYYMSANHSGQERTHGQYYQGAYSLKNMTNNLMISFTYDGDSTSATTLDYPVGTVYYSLAAYINSMIVKDVEGNANFIAAAKALYAFSEAAEAYSKK